MALEKKKMRNSAFREKPGKPLYVLISYVRSSELNWLANVDHLPVHHRHTVVARWLSRVDHGNVGLQMRPIVENQPKPAITGLAGIKG